MQYHQNIKTPKRFYSLDTLRGIAAIAVVFNHWKHFFYNGTDIANALDRSGSPLYSLFSIFYEYGWIAVDLFFSLSGFIFFWLYREAISCGNISAKKFAVLRFSRLYPLHILTLCLVAILQFISLNTTGDYVVYENNDLYHFVLNIFFAAGWGLEYGSSYNGPIWSVAVEVVLYSVFFGACYFYPRKVRTYLIFLVGLGLVLQIFNPHLGRGFFSFFIGGATYLVYTAILQKSSAYKISLMLMSGVAVIWAILLMAVNFKLLDTFLIFGNDILMGSYNGGFLLKVYEKVPFVITTAILFPLTILALAMIEACKGPTLKCISFLGDWSYSIYLLHFPLQLLAVLVFSYFEIDRSVFLSPKALGVFMVALFFWSFLSFTFIERPTQKYLREKFEGNAKSKMSFDERVG